MREGFTLLQRLVEESIIEYYASEMGTTVPDIELNMRVGVNMCSIFYIT